MRRSTRGRIWWRRAGAWWSRSRTRGVKPGSIFRTTRRARGDRRRPMRCWRGAGMSGGNLNWYDGGSGESPERTFGAVGGARQGRGGSRGRGRAAGLLHDPGGAGGNRRRPGGAWGDDCGPDAGASGARPDDLSQRGRSAVARRTRDPAVLEAVREGAADLLRAG